MYLVCERATNFTKNERLVGEKVLCSVKVNMKTFINAMVFRFLRLFFGDLDHFMHLIVA